MTGWTKATASDSNGSCVEVLRHPDGTTQVRDSKLGDLSAVLTFTRTEWTAFLHGAKHNEFG